jgi:hypothetical protein
VRAVVAEIIAATRKLRGPLEGINSAEEATAAGTKTANAWATYRSELLPKWKAAHELVKRLRVLHWIRPLPLDLAEFAQVGRPDLRVEDVRNARRAGRELLTLLDPLCDRWQLGGPYTEEEAAEFTQAIDAELGPQQDHGITVTTASRAVFA